MSALREAVGLEMRLRGFSPRTHESYLHAMEELWKFHQRSLERLTCQDVQRFLDEAITVRKLAWATINVYFSAFRFLYEQVLKRGAHEFSIPPRGRSRTRPKILSREEVRKLLDAPRNVKHRAFLSLVYGSGLRVSEAVNVKPVQVDRGRMMLFVTGKGHPPSPRLRRGTPGPVHAVGAPHAQVAGRTLARQPPRVVFLLRERQVLSDGRWHGPGDLLPGP